MIRFETLEKDFIVAFLKMGIKHNAVAQIYLFKQKEHESMINCANRLKKYITRCPIDEKPSKIDFNISRGPVKQDTACSFVCQETHELQ